MLQLLKNQQRRDRIDHEARRCHCFCPPCAIWELKNKKKLEPTSMTRPAASASSIAFDEVMPLLPSGAGQSL